MKKSMITQSVLCLLGAAGIGAFVVQAAPSDTDVFMPERAKARPVIQAIVRNLLNFRQQMPLSDEQKTKVRAVVDSHKAEILGQVKNARAARSAFHEAAKADPKSDAAVAAAGKIGEAAKNRALIAATIRSEVWPVLTEQQQQFAEKALNEVRAAAGQAISDLEKN